MVEPNIVHDMDVLRSFPACHNACISAGVKKRSKGGTARGKLGVLFKPQRISSGGKYRDIRVRVVCGKQT